MKFVKCDVKRLTPLSFPLWASFVQANVTSEKWSERVMRMALELEDAMHKDMEGAVGWVSLSEDPAAHSVTASYPLIAHQTAVYREGWGCQLQPWAK